MSATSLQPSDSDIRGQGPPFLLVSDKSFDPQKCTLQKSCQALSYYWTQIQLFPCRPIQLPFEAN